MSKTLVRDDLETRVYGEHEQRLGHVAKLVDGEWVYVGTYPGGSGTTPDSPVFKNGWTAVASDPLRFRWLLDGRPEIRGKFTGGASDTVVFTLPLKARPDNEYVVPYAGISNCVGSLTIEADGDVVWHDACGAAGGDGDLEDVITGISQLKGWWRMGENPKESDLTGNAFKFANSAQGFTSQPLKVIEYNTSGGLSLFPNGSGPPSLVGSDDGALMTPGVAGNRIQTPGDYNQYFSVNKAWTIACWFMPGYDDTFPAPSLGAANGFGHVCGPLAMDVGGSHNIGVGIVWRPYYADPDQSGPLLQVWRMASPTDFTKLTFPINTAGTKSTAWWENNNYRTSRNPGIDLPEEAARTAAAMTTLLAATHAAFQAGERSRSAFAAPPAARTAMP